MASMLSSTRVGTFELMLSLTRVSSSELLVSSLIEVGMNGFLMSSSIEVGTNGLLFTLFDRGQHFGLLHNWMPSLIEVDLFKLKRPL